MKKRVLAALLCAAMTASLLVGCGSNTGNSENSGSEPTEEDSSAADTSTEDKTNTGNTELSVEPKVYYGFESTDEGWTVVVEDTSKSSNKAYDASLATGATARTIVAGDIALADLTHAGVLGNCAYLNRSWAIDLELEPTNTDAWTVSFWVWGLGMTDYMPTVQFGSNMGYSTGSVSWVNFTKTDWNGTTYPMIWSRHEDYNSWPWMCGYDGVLHGYKEWVNVTLVATGETYESADGIQVAGAQVYIDGVLMYDAYDNYMNGTYFDMTDSLGNLAPDIMKPTENQTFESYVGINYWDTMYKGCIDEFYIFDQALSADDVLALYNKGNAAADPALDLSSEPVENDTVLLGANSLGANDFTQGWWTAFSEIWEVAEGTTKTISFKSYHTNLNFGTYMNPVVILQNVAAGHSTADDASYKEYIVARTDNYAWDAVTNTNAEGQTLCTATCDWNWDTFKDDTHDASFVVKITNNGTTADIVMEVTSVSGTTYTQSYTGITVDGAVYATLTLEKCCIDEITVE